MATNYRIRSSAWALPPTVIAFRGREGISEVYRFDVGVVWTADLPFAPEDAIGEPITLEIERDGAEPHAWHGVVEEIALVLEEGSSSYWLVTFGPRLRRLALTEHSRVFTDASIPDVLRAVLLDEGMPSTSFALGLTASYPERDHVCQYRESSLDFVRRLAEREGIVWSFEHGEEEETLRFVDDSRSAVASRGPVRYVPLTSDGAIIGEALGEFRATRRALPRSMRLHDYDPARPRLAVDGSAPVAAGFGGDVVRWGEHVTSPDEATRYARLRAEELACREELFHGHGVVVGLRPGAPFELVEHPGLDGEYLVTGLRHRGRVAGLSEGVLGALGLEELIGLQTQYRVDLTAVPHAVSYRAPSVTPWPRIAGVVTALVDGPASSSYAQIDDEGRYRVRIHFDEGDTADGSRSTWVRMLQPHGGQPEGMHFPLRKGTEVALVFLGGDPDRPFILGAAPNPETPSPVQRSNFTKNVIQTGSNNRLEMEDAAGGQYVTWSTPLASSFLHLGAGPKNFVLKTDGRGRIYTGGNLDVDVDVDVTEDVTGTVTETYHGTQTLTVTGAVTETFNTSLTWDVLGPVTNTWTGPYQETVDGHVSETFASTLTTTVNGAITTLTYDGGLTVLVAGDVLERFTASQSTTVNGPLTLIVGSNVTERFGSARRHVQGTYYLGVAGTYKIDAPTMVVNAPSWSFISNVANKLASTEVKVDPFAPKFRLTNSGKSAVSVTATGASLSAYGVTFSFDSTKVSVTLFEKKDQAAKCMADPVRVDQFGLLVISGGPKVS